ncbi:MAG: Uma2 family endonuclease [Spirochaetales bacterium]|nr:Uma2 family endonuclease [Spirochaetales bacterium]
MKTMADPALDLSGYWTYRDLKERPEEERWELIDGEAYLMSSPTVKHQDLVVSLTVALHGLLGDRRCRLLIAPLDILFPADPGQDEDEVDTVLQPDLIVVCDGSKVRERHVRGAPDLVIEILSRTTTKRDLRDKFAVYEKHGVREYWIVDPEKAWLTRFVRTAEGRFDSGETRIKGMKGDALLSTVIEGFSIDARELPGGD